MKKGIWILLDHKEISRNLYRVWTGASLEKFKYYLLFVGVPSKKYLRVLSSGQTVNNQSEFMFR